MHTEPHPQAGETVAVNVRPPVEVDGIGHLVHVSEIAQAKPQSAAS